ncbi:single-stranded DNA-binding protein [Mucilaginibacter terrenus]|nr:single-stranded DNA-binding protein [Mucilaginibacter terrenus]
MNQTSCINKVLLVGHVYDDAKWLKVENQQYLFCKLVTQETISKKEGPHMEYHQLLVPGSIVSSEVEFAKGGVLYVEGKVQTTAFRDANGVKRYNTEILVSRYNTMNSVLQPVA